MDRWKQIESLFEEAVNRPPAEREDFLRQACANDPDLYDEVASLVSQDADASNPETWAATAAARLIASGPQEPGQPLGGSLASGTTLGPYTIVHAVGAGAMGTVYRARDSRLNRDVAIKALSMEFAQDAQRLRRFQREAQMLGSLNHANIASIHDVLQADGRSYLVLEFVEGVDLAHRVQDGPLPPDEVLRVGRQIAVALQAAHDKGIVHRDLKPANIKVTPEGCVKVLDFGVAKATTVPTDRAEGELLVSGPEGTQHETLFVGTPAYMSPEQAAGQQVDQRADVWAFGCVIFELLAGQRAFHEPTPSDTLASILRADLNWQLLPSDTPDDLRQLVERCLQKDPRGRFQSGGDLSRALEQVEARRQALLEVASKRYPGRTATAAALLACIGGFLIVSNLPESRLRVEQTRQVTFAPELELDPALSPDGSKLAYAARSTTRTDIYVRRLDGDETFNLTESLPGAFHRWPRWSPDGKLIAFVSKTAGPEPYYSDGQPLWVIPSSGGQPRRVTTAGLLGHSWAPDGTQLAFALDNGIYIGGLDEADARRIAEVSTPHSLAWSPDGKWIAYVSGNYELLFSSSQFGNVAPSSIAIVPVDGGQPRQLTDKTASNISPTWMPDSRSILFVSNRDGSRDIFHLRLSDSADPVGEPVRLTTGLNALSIDIATDGHQLVHSVVSIRANLWSIPIPASPPVPVAAARPLTTGSQTVEGVGITRDGQWIVFDSNLAGNQDIFRMLRSGGQPEQLTTDPADDFSPSWSADGQSVAFHSFRNGNRDIYVMSADGTHQEQVTNDPAQERYPNWSPDGQSLVFYSDKPGHREVYIVSKEHGAWGQPRRLTFTQDSYHPRWSPDGRTIVYIDSRRGLSVMSPTGSSQQLLVPTEPALTPWYCAWSDDSQTIYFRAYDARNVGHLWSVPAAGGTPRQLVQFDAPSRIEFATDGKAFFFPKTEYEGDLWLLKLRK